MSQKSIKEQLRRTKITGGARYAAARRMEMQGCAAQWTLALLAIGQIIITLIPTLKLRSNFGEDYVGFASVLFAALVLAYSLLLGMADYSARAVKMHGCGLELGRLTRKLVFLVNRGYVSKVDYEECAKSYYDILDKHENHTRLDYLISHYQHYEAKVSKLDFSNKKYWRDSASLALVKAKIWTFQTIQFSHVVISLGLMYIWIYFMVRPATY
jgi:hypothetical protein